MRLFVYAMWWLLIVADAAQASEREIVVDVPTRPGVTQRFLYTAPSKPLGALVLFAGGHGGLQIASDGALGWGRRNFLVRTRSLFVVQGFAVAVVDAPSDLQSAPFLSGKRQRAEHATDIRSVIAWLRKETKSPVWLVGTSRGTQSVAYLATELDGTDAPDGIVLTATVVRDPRGRPVPQMPLHRIRVPVLVAHHERDGCSACAFADVPPMMKQFTNAPRKHLLAFDGGIAEGDPCEAMAYHGFNGIEHDVIAKIAAWVRAK
jgi:dienelactone hydrolase